jgi:mannose-1-phosphate guanylyltransferase/mannose-6-phosphate isomerase
MRGIYANLPSGALDTLVLEKTRQLVVVPAELGWSDVGSWDAFHRQSPHDSEGNAVSGNAIVLGARGSLVRAGRRLVAVVGARDLVIVDTEDALLVCDMQSVQDVKKLVDQLKAEGRREADEFATTHRPWGSYTVMAEGASFKVKELVVKPRQKLSLQSHTRRAEHWVVVAGRPTLTCGEERREFNPGEYLFIPVGAKHRIENPGEETVRIFEVQSGDYLGEDDIVRYEDIYGRA